MNDSASASSDKEYFVRTSKLKEAIRGRETEIIDALGIPWRTGRPHITCPYPSHGGKSDWRWNEKEAKAHCTCSHNDSIFDVVSKCKGIDFDAAKIRIAELLCCDSLIECRAKTKRYQATDSKSLLNPAADNRDDQLPRNYLAARLGCPADQVVMPQTAAVGIVALEYFDAGPTRSSKPTVVGCFPCAVFETIDAQGKRHAHRIYLAPGGAGKANLGHTSDGTPREAKKSAKLSGKDNIAGRSVIWGDPAKAPVIIVAEGIETAAAIAQSYQDELSRGEVAVAAAISAVGVEAFGPWHKMQRLIVAADRDELGTPGRPGSRRGERAARTLGLRWGGQQLVAIAMPGAAGESTDWLDIFLAQGRMAVRAGIDSAAPLQPTDEELTDEQQRTDQRSAMSEVERLYPLPRLMNTPLQYAYADDGSIYVHKYTERKGGDTPLLSVVATPFGVPARVRFADQADAFGLRVTVQDMRGNCRELDIERAALARMAASEIRAMMFGAGLRTENDGEQIAVACLKAADPDHEIVAVRRSGWHEIDEHLVFMCPDGSLQAGQTGSTLELTGNVRMPAEVARRGTLEGWQRAITAAGTAQGVEHWTLGIVSGLVGPILSLCGLDTCGINLSGLSSSGKSTAQKLAASAWSTADVRRDGLFQSARSTDNALEGAASRANGTVLALDELAHVQGKIAAKMIYTIAGGIGKKRMAADASVRRSLTWSTFAILSGECSLEEKIKGDGGDWMAGMAVRIVDIDITGVNRTVDRKTLMAIETIDQHFGHAGPAFVERLIEGGIQLQPNELRERINSASRIIAGQKVSDSTILRASVPFALLSVAGQLAKQTGILPAVINLDHAVRWAWARFISSSYARVLTPEQDAIASLSSWIAGQWNVSIRSTATSEAGAREALGWYNNEAVFIRRHLLREAAGSSLKESSIAEILDRGGMLTRKSDATHRYVKWVPQIGRVEAYALTRTKFGRTEDDCDPDSELSVVQGGRQ